MLFIGCMLLVTMVLIVCVWRAISLKPTKAITATIPEADHKRSEQYGEKVSKMLQVETISDIEQTNIEKFYTFHQVIEEIFPHLHQHCEKVDIEGSLLFIWKGKTDTDPILLMSHYDVVEPNGQWKYDPFGGEIHDGKVYGRGAVDTKSSLFCILQAVEELLIEGYIPTKDVYIASSCTEEISGPGAAKTAAYLKQQGIHLKMLLDEGGFVLEEPLPGIPGKYAMIGTLEKASVDVKFIAKSKGGHASAPERNTGLVRLGKFMSHMEMNNPFTVQFDDTVLEMLRRMTPNMPFKRKLLFANMWLFKPLLKKTIPSVSAQGAAMLRTTIAFTMASGSQGLNVLPKEAYITANLRCTHHQPPKESIAIVQDMATKYDLTTEVILENKISKTTDYQAEPFRLVEEAVHTIYPDVMVCPYVLTAGTDTKYYTEVCDHMFRFAPLYIRPEQFHSMHTIDENIDVNALPHGVDFYKHIIKS